MPRLDHQASAEIQYSIPSQKLASQELSPIQLPNCLALLLRSAVPQERDWFPGRPQCYLCGANSSRKCGGFVTEGVSSLLINKELSFDQSRTGLGIAIPVPFLESPRSLLTKNKFCEK